MNIDAQLILEKMAKTVGELHLRVAILEAQIDTMTGGEKNAANRPTKSDHGHVEEPRGSGPGPGPGENGADETGA